MFKKLLVWAAVLLVAAALAVPSFAQTSDLSLVWGSAQWLKNQFGDKNGDMTTFCQPAAKDKVGWSAQFPNLVGLYGWSVEGTQ